MYRRHFLGVGAVALMLGGCGLYTPDMYYPSALAVPEGQGFNEADFESNLVSHVGCELSRGLLMAHDLDPSGKSLGWLMNSGALVTFKLIAEDQSSLNPNASFLTSLPAAQSFTLGLGASASANATRTETIQLTFPDKALYGYAKENVQAGHTNCNSFQKGVMIDSNLKIADFIYNKAVVANNFFKDQKSSPFSQLQFEINFVATYSGNVTPTWKFTKISVDSSGNLASATRTNTNDILFTIGALNSDTKALHNATLTGGAAGQSFRSSGP